VYALVLDTATPAVVVGVVELAGPADDPAMAVTVRAARAPADARRHGEMLAPTVQAVLADAGLAVSDLGAIVAGLGPGPFTGLRVGLVTAASLSDALGVPAYGVCSLDAIAPPGRALVVTDARRHEVYWAAYADGVRTHGPEVDRPDDLADRISALGVTACAGPAAEEHAAVLGLPVTAPTFPDPRALAVLAAARIASGEPSDPLTPLYLRRPDATPPTHRKSAVPA
jgi:tRNA threonylcarbamoyl adenosine modification protein YeaZ